MLSTSPRGMRALTARKEHWSGDMHANANANPRSGPQSVTNGYACSIVLSMYKRSTTSSPTSRARVSDAHTQRRNMRTYHAQIHLDLICIGQKVFGDAKNGILHF